MGKILIFIINYFIVYNIIIEILTRKINKIIKSEKKKKSH